MTSHGGAAHRPPLHCRWSGPPSLGILGPSCFRGGLVAWFVSVGRYPAVRAFSTCWASWTDPQSSGCHTRTLKSLALHSTPLGSGWGPGPPRLVEQRNPGITGTTRQAKSPGRPENHPRALAGRTAVASGKSARLMPNSPPPVTPPSSRGSWPRTNRIKSDALAAGRHAGPVQVEGSRGKNATDRKPAARQPDISGKGMFGQRND
jgi:hypothetical protein